MSRLIDADALRLMKVEECAGHTIDYALGWKACIDWVRTLPTVDAAPVVHGRPVWINPLEPGAKICTLKCSSLCSACGDYVAVSWKYCPNCGANMGSEES